MDLRSLLCVLFTNWFWAWCGLCLKGFLIKVAGHPREKEQVECWLYCFSSRYQLAYSIWCGANLKWHTLNESLPLASADVDACSRTIVHFVLFSIRGCWHKSSPKAAVFLSKPLSPSWYFCSFYSGFWNFKLLSSHLEMSCILIRTILTSAF